MPDDAGPRPGCTITSSYWDRTPYVEEDEDGAAQYVEHHRTLGDWVALLAGQGFMLTALHEPQWPEGLDRIWGGWGPLRGRLVPGTAIFVARLLAALTLSPRLGVSRMRSPSRLMAGGASIALAIAVMNLATYASTVLAARLLGPREYGGFAAFTGLLLVLGVLMLGLQTAGARRVASDPDRVGQIEGMLLRVTYRCAWVLAGGLRPAHPGLRDRARPAQLGDRGPGRARGVADDRGRRRLGHPPGRAPVVPAGRWSTSAWACRAWPRRCCCSGSPPRPWPPFSMLVGFLVAGAGRVVGAALGRRPARALGHR